MDNTTKAPSSRGMLIPGKHGKLLANSYLPGGEGPYPVVVICHGIPGIERLFDFSLALREAGFGNAWNLRGGILAWIERIDPSLAKY